MKTITRLIAAHLLLLAFIQPGGLLAQGVSSSGTDFWMGFMPNAIPGGYIRMELFIASGTANKVKVDFAGNLRSYTVPTNSVIDVQIDQNAITKDAEVPTNNAIHVTSVNPITIYGYSVWGSAGFAGGSPDGFLALPLPAYGTKYYTVNYYDLSVWG